MRRDQTASHTAINKLQESFYEKDLGSDFMPNLSPEIIVRDLCQKLPSATEAELCRRYLSQMVDMG